MASHTHHGSGRGWPAALWVLLFVVLLALAVLVAVPSLAAVSGAFQGSGSSSGSSATGDGQTDAGGSGSGSTDGGDAGTDAEGPSSNAALAQLSEVPDASGEAAATYFREQFGQAWYDQDRNGCDTRNDILGRDLTEVVFKEDTNGCKVLAGTLLDPYTGETVLFESGANTSALVQVDHMIPLAWAWRHGAEEWSFEKRMEFANDPANLLAVTGTVNQSKSDSGPSQWLPPLESAHCAYAEQFVSVLVTWELGVNADDRRALENVLQGCA